MKNCSTEAACMGRREFLVKAGLVAGATVLTISSVGNAFGAGQDIAVGIASDSPLAKVGGFEIVDSPAGKLIVINEGDDKFAALSAVCTHKGALMTYDASSKKVMCPKHGSAFDEKTGAVTKGPANDPIASYPAHFEPGKVVVKVA